MFKTLSEKFLKLQLKINTKKEEYTEQRINELTEKKKKINEEIKQIEKILKNF